MSARLYRKTLMSVLGMGFAAVPAVSLMHWCQKNAPVLHASMIAPLWIQPIQRMSFVPTAVGGGVP